MDILEKILDGAEVTLRNGWEYRRLEEYEGNEPGVILGVFRRTDISGWYVIAHDYQGRVVINPGMGSTVVLSDLELVLKQRKFLVKVRRTVVEDAYVEVEAVDRDEALENAAEVAEEMYHELEWDEYNTEYEALEVKREVI